MTGDTHRLFEELNIMQNKTYGWLTCGECGWVLTVEWWHHVNGHRHRDHLPEVTEEEMANVETLRQAHQNLPFQPTPNMAPVQGLLLYKGLICLTCEQDTPHCGGNEQGLRQHHYRTHQDQPVQHEPGWYQTLGRVGDRHFRVSLDISIPRSCHLFNLHSLFVVVFLFLFVFF